MIGKGPRHERETVINFNEAEPMASVWTASEIVYRKLRKLGYMPSEDEGRHAVFTVPKSVVKVLKLRAKREMTQAQREALRRGRLSPGALENSRANETNGHDTAVSKG
ncbi:MAG: hypothetical protein HYY46_23165 [Deltaproteobacteria bacterium]|nr:hypothetical protein [Deltaproteobacteria bacterium]